MLDVAEANPVTLPGKKSFKSLLALFQRLSSQVVGAFGQKVKGEVDQIFIVLF